MIALVVVIHILVCVTLIGVVLLQQGKGADVGAVFGGSSQTVFGASGAGNLLTKVTGVCAVIFFTTSLILAYSSTRHATSSIFEGVKVPMTNLPPGNLGAPVAPPALGGKIPGPTAGAGGSMSPVSSPAASLAGATPAPQASASAAVASVVASPMAPTHASVVASPVRSVAPSPAASVAPSVAPTAAATHGTGKPAKTTGQKIKKKIPAASAP